MERRLATLGFAVLSGAAVAALSVLAMASAPPELGDAFAQLTFWIVQAAALGVGIVLVGAIVGTARDGWTAFRKPKQ